MRLGENYQHICAISPYDDHASLLSIMFSDRHTCSPRARQYIQICTKRGRVHLKMTFFAITNSADTDGHKLNERLGNVLYLGCMRPPHTSQCLR